MTQDGGQESHSFGSGMRAHPLWRFAMGYALAIVATGASFAITFALRRSTSAPLFLFFVLAVALSAWYGGRGPSVLAIVLSVLLVRYAPKNPVGSLWTNNVEEPLPFVITDDGTGFDVAAAKARSQAGESLGLAEMAEIAYMAGAPLTLTSAEGKGTIVRAQFPLYSVE